jgi:hypothetical protein
VFSPGLFVSLHVLQLCYFCHMICVCVCIRTLVFNLLQKTLKETDVIIVKPCWECTQQTFVPHHHILGYH